MVSFMPLRGSFEFQKLMNTRPASTASQYHVHIATPISKPATSKPATSPKIDAVYLGLIVPKKRYPLAVDRNRVRRVCRALTRAAIQTAEQTTKQIAKQEYFARSNNTAQLNNIAILFRFKPSKRDKKQAVGLAIEPAVNNPHSKFFAAHLKMHLTNALNNAIKNTSSNT